MKIRHPVNLRHPVQQDWRHGLVYYRYYERIFHMHMIQAKLALIVTGLSHVPVVTSRERLLA